MLALIAGTGSLPGALVSALDEPPLICAMDPTVPEVAVDLRFRLEHLGGFLKALKERGITTICMAGAVKRPQIDTRAIDVDTRPFVPRIQTALHSGDDTALRAIISIFEDSGFVVRAAQDIAPDLLPTPGVQTNVAPTDTAVADAALAEETIAAMGAADIGQACVVGGAAVLAREDQAGTDAMLERLTTAPGATANTVAIDPAKAKRAVLFKAAKPGQDRRADLPVIGPRTVQAAISAGLAGIVIEAGNVMVLGQAEVIERLDAAGMFLWVRPRGGT